MGGRVINEKKAGHQLCSLCMFLKSSIIRSKKGNHGSDSKDMTLLLKCQITKDSANFPLRMQKREPEDGTDIQGLLCVRHCACLVFGVCYQLIY